MTKAEIKEFGADTMHDRSSLSVLEDNFGKIRYWTKKISMSHLRFCFL